MKVLTSSLKQCNRELLIKTLSLKAKNGVPRIKPFLNDFFFLSIPSHVINVLFSSYIYFRSDFNVDFIMNTRIHKDLSNCVFVNQILLIFDYHLIKITN